MISKRGLLSTINDKARTKKLTCLSRGLDDQGHDGIAAVQQSRRTKTSNGTTANEHSRRLSRTANGGTDFEDGKEAEESNLGICIGVNACPSH